MRAYHHLSPKWSSVPLIPPLTPFRSEKKPDKHIKIKTDTIGPQNDQSIEVINSICALLPYCFLYFAILCCNHLNHFKKKRQMKTVFIIITVLIVIVLGGLFALSMADMSPEQTQVRKEITIENN